MRIILPNKDDTSHSAFRQLVSTIKAIAETRRIPLNKLLNALKETAENPYSNAINKLLQSDKTAVRVGKYFDERSRQFKTGVQQDEAGEILADIAEALNNYSYKHAISWDSIIDEIINGR